MKYLLLPLVFLLSASLASACSFTPDADRMQPAESNIDKYENIFVGEVIGKLESTDGFSGNTYAMRVHNMYKGAAVETFKLHSAGHSCGSFYEVGRVGLFFLNDTTTIDESNPQYFYNSTQEALDATKSLFTESGTLVTIPNPIEPQSACTKEYAPVCGELIVQCVKAPCDPIRKTYDNKCLLEKEGARLISTGECKVPVTEKPAVVNPPVIETPQKPNLQEQVKEIQEVTNSFEGPKTGPLVGFVEPTTPPPVKNIEQTVEKRSKIRVIIDWYQEKIGGLFSWFF